MPVQACYLSKRVHHCRQWLFHHRAQRCGMCRLAKARLAWAGFAMVSIIRALQKNGQWAVFTSTYRSANHRYLFTDAQGARLSLRFLGDAARVRYVRLSSYGVFEVRIDGRVVTTVDAYLPKSVANGDFVTTDVFGLVHGWHTFRSCGWIGVTRTVPAASLLSTALMCIKMGRQQRRFR